MPRTHSDETFIYSVDMMLAYINIKGHAVTKIPISDLVHNLDYQGWESAGEKYSARDVLSNPAKYAEDHARIVGADLSFPIIIVHRTDGPCIVDGVHRLSKAHGQRDTAISAYIFDEALMKKFILASRDEVHKARGLQLFDIIKMYVDRFGH